MIFEAAGPILEQRILEVLLCEKTSYMDKLL